MRTIITLGAAAAAVWIVLTIGLDGHGKESKPFAAPEVSAAEATKTAFVEGIEQHNGRYVLTLDYIDWFEGDAATQIFREREPDPEVTEPPDGYYIVNDDTTLETVVLSENAHILMQIYDRPDEESGADIVPDEPITIEQFAELIEQGEEAMINVKDFPYHITLKDGQADVIVQQFIP
ncbi:hypothetical protein [Paenibacillus xylaniclasticus]|uniref:hypothetical protein n=1 Tax=Paenibacillus xylaniclasticus TaxID=588083 RepID=UPI000FD841D6|nr:MULTISPECIES: hypothetical protein [Paenibacillus]GFN31755.1 hypothetical protein PCURB6_20150 [Paenibacillus curdlanolyticus]